MADKLAVIKLDCDLLKNLDSKLAEWFPRGCLTEDGANTELITIYGCHESKSDKYPPRTFDNVKNSDATIRLAYDFNSAGEKLTLKAIYNYNRNSNDVNMNHPQPALHVAQWLLDSNIAILNVSGNRESTHPGIGVEVEIFLDSVFSNYKKLLDMREKDASNDLGRK